MGKKGKPSLEELLEQALVKDEPYEVPENWLYFYFTSLIDIQGGTQPPKSHFVSEPKDGYVRLVQIRDFSSDNYKVYIPAKNNLRYFEENDILIARYGASIGRICSGLSGACNVALAKTTFSPKVFNRKFIYWLLNSEYFQRPLQFISRTAQAGFNKDDLAQFAMPLPTLPEQQRIVTLIESLFEKLDRAKELAQNALDSFENRKSAILHKAFTGELTSKWREENVYDNGNVFKNIKAQRLNLCNSSNDVTRIMNEWDLVTVNANLPNNWINLKALLICDFITKGETPTKFVSNKEEIPFLKVYNIRDNKIDFTYQPSYIPREIHDQRMKRSKVFPNDVIMNIVGPPLQKVAIVSNEHVEWNINQAIAIFRPVKDVLPKYLYYCLLCENTLKTVLVDTRGVVGQSNISLEQCRNLLIPIPPLPEQKEIVRILDNLLENEQKAKELCDVIDKIDHIKKSILAKAFRGELGTNHPEEESALELLKEVLQEKSK